LILEEDPMICTQEKSLSVLGSCSKLRLCLMALACLLLGLGGFMAPAVARDKSALQIPDLTPASLVKLSPPLAAGGYVFYFRHGNTQLDQEDQKPIVIGDCSTQRILSEQGRALADRIGEGFRRARIPVGRIISSPSCRTMETALRAFGKAEALDDVYFMVGIPKAERQRRTEALRQLLATSPQEGTNLVIVSHMSNLEEAIQLWPEPEGAGYLFHPDGKGAYRIVGRLAPTLWEKLGY
jgi:phosphohistidine phosphatase SixA